MVAMDSGHWGNLATSQKATNWVGWFKMKARKQSIANDGHFYILAHKASLALVLCLCTQGNQVL